MVEYILHTRQPDGYNADWIDEVYSSYNKITERTIKRAFKKMAKANKLNPYNTFNIDIIMGPKSIVCSCEDYEYCIGYAVVYYDEKEIQIKEMEVIS